jgi:hypothetical protein
MLSEVARVGSDSISIRGYIRQNFLCAKRLLHITGMNPSQFAIKKISIAKDPCPLKLSHKEKEKVLSTSTAQSIVSSRQSSRKGSLDVSLVSGSGDPETNT